MKLKGWGAFKTEFLIIEIKVKNQKASYQNSHSFSQHNVSNSTKMV